MPAGAHDLPVDNCKPQKVGNWFSLFTLTSVWKGGTNLAPNATKRTYTHNTQVMPSNHRFVHILVAPGQQNLTFYYKNTSLRTLADPGLNVRGNIPCLPPFSEVVRSWGQSIEMFIPLEVGPPRLQLGGLGERSSSPSGSRQSPASRQTDFGAF